MENLFIYRKEREEHEGKIRFAVHFLTHRVICDMQMHRCFSSRVFAIFAVKC